MQPTNIDSSRVLVIEDNLELAEIFADVLVDAGFLVDIIHDGQAALDWLNHEQNILPSVITLDMHLPHVSGDAILKHIRSTGRLANITVVVITANPILGDMMDPLADMVLLKPVSYDQVSTLVDRLALRYSNAASV
jgi:two-component system OmpR family response regulator